MNGQLIFYKISNIVGVHTGVKKKGRLEKRVVVDYSFTSPGLFVFCCFNKQVPGTPILI